VVVLVIILYTQRFSDVCFVTAEEADLEVI